MVVKAKSENPIKPLRGVERYERWQVPSIHSNGHNDFRQEQCDNTSQPQELITAEALQNIKDQAYTEGFDKGRREGLNSAENEIENKTRLLDSLIKALTEPVAQCGQQTQQQLLELAFAVSRQIVRRELKQDPTQLIAIIRDALQLLPVASKNIRIFLHPEDASIVREVLSIDKTLPDAAWQLVEEPSMERGGCLLKTDNSTVDASVDRQIAVLFSCIAGGQRTGESPLAKAKPQSKSESNPKSSQYSKTPPDQAASHSPQAQDQANLSKPNANG